MRLWWEVSNNVVEYCAASEQRAMQSGAKWFPHNKGGSFRKWYGNNDYLVNWENYGSEIKRYRNEADQLAARPQNIDCYFKECVTWSKISSGRLAFRYKEPGSIFNEVGPAFFADRDTLLKLEAFLNSAICFEAAKALSPTLDFQVGQVADYPVLDGVLDNDDAIDLADSCTSICKNDWDSFEESWGFKRHPLI